ASTSSPVQSGWAAFVNNTSGSAVTFEVEAVCARKPRRYTIKSGPFVENPSGTQVRATVTCPSGSKPLSGGVSATSDSLAVNINSTMPEGRDWVAEENNASPDAGAGSAFVVCAKLPGYTVVLGDSFDNPAGGSTESFATCPAPTLPVGGGASSNALSHDVNVGGMGISGTGFVSFMDNASAFDFLSSTTAICAGT